MLRYAIAAGLLGLGACASAPATETGLSSGVDWVANSDSWAEEAEAVYFEAQRYITRESQGRATGSWAVVLDVDETVLNNVAYQVEREACVARGACDEVYTPESWYDWTQREAAPLVPGARRFLEAVAQRGGHVAFVTNRKDREQLATENNLAAVGLTRGEDFRVLLTRASPDGPSRKEGRFMLVPLLLAAQGYPSVDILAYVGDANGDKPDGSGEWEFFCIDQGAMYGDPCAEVPGPGR